MISEIHHVEIMFYRLLCLCFVAGVVCAQEPTVCMISGTIKDDLTGAPITNATLILLGVELTTMENASDGAGNFTLTLAARHYAIMALAKGYAKREKAIDCRGTVTAFDFALHPEAVITGRVTDDEGRPTSQFLPEPRLSGTMDNGIASAHHPLL
jgi:hypothetical protein